MSSSSSVLEPRKRKRTNVKRQWLTPYKRNQKAAEGGWRCFLCAMTLPALFHIDHIIPLREWTDSNTNPNAWENLCALCPSCHAKKSALETERYWDREHENRTGVSKYFNPHSKYYLPPIKPPPGILQAQQRPNHKDTAEKKPLHLNENFGKVGQVMASCTFNQFIFSHG